MWVKASFSLGLTGLTWPARLASDKYSFQEGRRLEVYSVKNKARLSWECFVPADFCAPAVPGFGLSGNPVLHKMSEWWEECAYFQHTKKCWATVFFLIFLQVTFPVDNLEWLGRKKCVKMKESVGFGRQSHRLSCRFTWDVSSHFLP